jgi:tetratricopeptide (TPR) repeat protein
VDRDRPAARRPDLTGDERNARGGADDREPGRSTRPRRDERSARPRDDRAAGFRDRDRDPERRRRPDARDRGPDTAVRVVEPALPDDVSADELAADVRRDLRGLQKDTADSVARHLVAAGSLVDDDPGEALAHARYARHRASRIAAVREAAGIAAYHAGEWNEALGELRAARRMGGGPGHLAVMADIERALGRPERALELARGPEATELDRAEAIELAIVAAGARRDLGELDAAVVGLQLPELDPDRHDPWSARLFYAYADNLLAAGRRSEAIEWFLHTANADDAGETDAAVRLAELTGEPLSDDDGEFGEDVVPVDDVEVDAVELDDDDECAGAGPGPAGGNPADEAIDEDGLLADVDDQVDDQADHQVDDPGTVDVPSSVADPVSADTAEPDDAAVPDAVTDTDQSEPNVPAPPGDPR